MANRENLEHLKQLLAQIPQGRFDLSQWNNLYEDINAPVDLSVQLEGKYKGCGYVGCVMGWAAIDPYFNRQGLSLNKNGDIVFNTEIEVDRGPSIAAEQLFAIPAAMAYGLIGVDYSGLANEWIRFFYDLDGRIDREAHEVSETDVIRAIDWILANEDYAGELPPEGTLHIELQA